MAITPLALSSRTAAILHCTKRGFRPPVGDVLMPYDKSSVEYRKWYNRTENIDTKPSGNPGIWNDVYPISPSGGVGLVQCGSSVHGDTMRDWRKRIARGDNATTTFVASETAYEHDPWRNDLRGSTLKDNLGWSYQRKQSSWWSGDLATASGPSTACVTSATNLASTRFYKKLHEKYTLFEGGTALGELMETLRMIASPAKALRTGIDDYLNVAKKRRKGPRSIAQKAVADTWLEYAFGWAPLLNDLDSAIGYLAKRESQLTRKFFRVVGTGSASESSDLYTTKSFNFATARSRILTTKMARMRYIGVVSATSGNGAPVSYMKSIGLTADNFIPTLWELLPWSFAIDYFTNIGDIISIYSRGRIGLAWGCQTLVTESRNHLTEIRTMPVAASLKTTWYNASKGGQGYSWRKTVNRAPITYVPLPGFEFEIPGMGTKWLNLAGLVASRRASSSFKPR